MSEINFSKEEKEIIVKKIQSYLSTELDQEIGQFDAEFLLDFFAKEVGSFFYNRGLYDAQQILLQKMEDISDVFYELEKATPSAK